MVLGVMLAGFTCTPATAPQVFVLQDGSSFIGPVQTDNLAHGINVSSPIDRFCSGPQKVICAWDTHFNTPQEFEKYGTRTDGRPGIDEAEPSTTPTHLYMCGIGTTLGGLCESYGPIAGAVHNEDWRPFTPEAISIHDIGAASASLPLPFFVELMRDEFQKQSDNRLGSQTGPAGEDVALWLDFTVNLKDHEDPIQSWIDVTGFGLGYMPRFPAILTDTTVRTEIIMQSWFRVDGDLKWSLDPDWLGTSTGDRILATSIQVAT